MLTPRIRSWFKLLFKFISVQLIVQALGFSSGILIINSLSKTEYSYYLITNTLQFTIDLMSDIGITIGLNSIGGKVYNNPIKFSQLIVTAFLIKRYLLIAATVLILPVLFFLLFNKGASIQTIALLTLAVLLELQFYSTNKILIIVPRLNSSIDLIQKLDFILALTRIVGISLAYLWGMNVVTATFCSTLASGTYSFFLYRFAKDKIDFNSPINGEYRSQITRLVKAQFFPTVFYCLQGQITIWIVTVFGNFSSIAEIGALSRLGLVLTIFNPVINNIIVPSYARVQSIELLKKRYWQLLCIFGFVFGGILIFASIFSQQLLSIIGTKYAHLNNELILVAIGSLISTLTAMIWGLNYSQAWVERYWLVIPSTIAIQLLLVLVLDLSNARGAILFGLFSTIPPLCVNLYMSLEGMKTRNIT